MNPKTTTAATPQRLLIDGADWKTYLRVLRVFDERPGWRVTYDRGTLEIMNQTFGHGNYGYHIGRLIDALTEELNQAVAGGDSTTFKRRKKKRGLEPDKCYWLANEPRVRGKLRIDLRIDPPPDLAVEVDVTSSSINRMQIYAALGVPEVWRYDGSILGFFLLGSGGQYGPISTSLASELVRFVQLREHLEQNEIIRQFRAWVRQQIATGVLQAPA